MEKSISKQLAKRALAVFDYLQAVIRLGLKVFRTVDEHKEFILFQSELPDAPGVSTFTTSGEDLFWLSVNRQNIPAPPELPKILEGWIEVPNDPNREPEIIEQKQPISGDRNQRVVSFDEESDRENAFLEYLGKWRQWAEDNRAKKQVQNLFESLFKVNEQLKYDEQLELIWGYGILLWKSDRHTIKYPLITQRMAIEHRAGEGVIHIFPEDDTNPKLELDMLIDTGLPDLTDIRGKLDETVQSPEEPASNESLYPLGLCRNILKEIAGRLTPEGKFVELSEDSDLIPKKDLSVVDCWVLFLRKRQQDAVTRDIKAFQDKLRGKDRTARSIFIIHTRSRGKAATAG